jgi:predicted N-acetyltransferase YhbS
MTTISFKLNIALNSNDVSSLFIASGIKRPVDDLERLQRMVDNSNLTISAWHENKLIGLARAVTDYSYCCYLSDLAVDKDYQKQGVGEELVRLVQKEIGEEVALILLSSPTAMNYYPKIGFDKIENGFIIRRSR